MESPIILPSFICVVCEDIHSTPPITVVTESFCSDCFTTGILPQFHAALKSEVNYPVKYGPTPLNILDFAEFFDEVFLSAREWKQEEYETPIQRRVYCNHDDRGLGRCGEFVGEKARQGEESRVLECRACHGLVCNKCCASLPRRGSTTHECHQEPVDEEMNPFTHMSRGTDYQTCPNSTCQAGMMLWDGCNEIHCKFCHTPFCFICGEAVPQPQSGHWKVGKPCPRFGKRDDSRAIHDDGLQGDVLAPGFGFFQDPEVRAALRGFLRAVGEAAARGGA